MTGYKPKVSRRAEEEKQAHLNDLWELQMFLGKILKLDPGHRMASSFAEMVKSQQKLWHDNYAPIPRHLRLDKTKVHELLDPELTRLRKEKKETHDETDS